MSDYQYLIRGGIEGRERLRVLSRVLRPTTLPLLRRAGVTAGLGCLDVGCGGGDVSFDLASLVGLTGQVLGLDVDASKIELARADAAQVAVTNIEFRVGDLSDGLGEEEYDVVYARFLLTHLRDPVAGVATMMRALRPGGRLVVEDIDFRGSFCEPQSAMFARYEDIYEESARASGGDPWITLRGSGDVCRRRTRTSSADNRSPADLVGESKLMPALTLENIRGTALRHGVATAEEIDRLVDELYALARDESTFLANQPPHGPGDRRKASLNRSSTSRHRCPGWRSRSQLPSCRPDTSTASPRLQQTPRCRVPRPDLRRSGRSPSAARQA